MRNFLMLFIIAFLSIGSVSAIEISEFQSKIKTIETQDEQIKYLESIQEDVLSTNNQEIITQYYKDLHWLYYENSIAQKSVETADILISIFEKENNLELKAKYLIYKSEDFILYSDDYEKAKTFVKEALKIAEDLNNNDLKILALANLGALESYIGYYFKALETLNEAELLITDTSNYENIRELYNQFVNVFYNMKNKEKRREYIEKILEIYRLNKIKKDNNYIVELYNYSFLLNSKKEKKELYDEIIELIKVHNKSINGTLYEIIARMDIEEEKSLNYIDKSIKIFESFKNEYEIYLSKKTKIKLLLKRKMFKESINIINGFTKEEQNRTEILKLTSETYEGLGDNEKALEYAMEYQKSYENGFNKVFIKTVKDLRNMFQTVEKEKENTILLRETREKQEKIRDEQTKLIEKERFIMFSYFSLIVILVLCIVSILAYRRIKIKATIDDLTKVYNRKTIQNIADKIFKNNRSKPLSLIFFDIDHFKKINDKFGHQAGDIVLQKVSSTVKKTLRRDDKVGRFGGEEFLIISRNGLGVTDRMAERLRKEIQKLTFEEYPDIKVTASFGLATRTSEDNNISDIIKRADDKLYEAKENGRNIIAK
tara:strand:+ start:16247 stop:18049 length:1803 start_codon:yes stop_codon:yes gene_type:complete